MSGPGGVGVTPVFDPRLRIVFTLASAIVFLSVRHHAVLVMVLVLMLAICGVHRGIGWRVLRRRLVAVNLFSLMLLVFIPWSTDGNPLFHWGPLAYTREGALDAFLIALKANAVVLVVTWLLTPVEPMMLGHAVAGLGAPERLVQLYVLTVRYLRVLEDEYRRLRRAMTIRGFRARADLHTLRTFGNLVGMLLIRALDRAERIWQAMVCRGFMGRFPRGAQPRLGVLDAAIAVGAVVVLGAVVGLDRLAMPW